MDDRRRLILDEALALADEEGLDAVTMRAVASRFGLTSMALYPYVGSKQALLDGLVDVLLGDLLSRIPDSDDWRCRLTGLGRATRAVAVAHPGAFTLLSLRPSNSGRGRLVAEVGFAALLAAGVPERDVPRLERLIWTVALGYSTATVTGRLTAAGLPPVDPGLPAHRRLQRWLDGGVDPEAELEATLADLIRLVEARASA